MLQQLWINSTLISSSIKCNIVHNCANCTSVADKILNPKNFIPDNSCCVTPHNMGVVEEHSNTTEDKWSRVEGGGRSWLSWWLVIKIHTLFFLSDEFKPLFLVCDLLSSATVGRFLLFVDVLFLILDTIFYLVTLALCQSKGWLFIQKLKMCYILPKLQYYTTHYIL